MAPGPVEEFLPRAVLATDKGRVDEAIDLYRRALEEEPENDIARNNLGCLLLDESRIDEALEVLDGESGKAAPNQIRNTLGYALLTQGDFRRAEQVFRGILEDDAEDVDARNHLGMVLLRRGQHEAALAEFLRVAREHPESVTGWNNLGYAYQSRGELNLAREAFHEALGIDPYNADAHNNLGCVLRDRGHVAEGLEEMKLAATLAPEDAAIQLNLAVSYHRQNAPEKALSHLRRHLKFQPPSHALVDVHSLLRELETIVGGQSEESQ